MPQKSGVKNQLAARDNISVPGDEAFRALKFLMSKLGENVSRATTLDVRGGNVPTVPLEMNAEILAGLPGVNVPPETIVGGKVATRQLAPSMFMDVAGVGKIPGRVRVFHETDTGNATSLLTGRGDDLIGLNVARDPDLALGQRGKGALVELDVPNEGLRTRLKQGSDVGELELLGGRFSGDVQGIVISPNTNISKIHLARLESFVRNGSLVKESLSGGRVAYRRPDANLLAPRRIVDR